MTAPQQTLESPDGLAGQSLGAAPGSVPGDQYLAALTLAMELALELREICNSDMHHQQVRDIQQLLDETKTPNVPDQRPGANEKDPKHD